MSRFRQLAKFIDTWSVELILFFTLLLCYAYFLPRWADWSQNSRLNLVLAIVDQGTLAIDDYYQNTGDYALFEGRYYTDKAPGPSFLGVPVYAAVRPVLQSEPVQNMIENLAANPAFAATQNEEGTGLTGTKIYYAIVLYIVTVVVVGIPAALLGVLLYRFLLELGTGPGWSAVIVLIYGLATNAFAYAGAFYSHQLTAFLLFAAFFLGFQMKQKRLKPVWVVGAGLLLGYALISEYPSALIAGAIFLYIFFSIPQWRWRGALILAGIPPGLLLMAYDWAIFRTPLPVGYKYSELYTDLHSTGFMSLTYPHPSGLWGITFGSFRGLFFVSPVLLLAVAGFWLWWRSRRHRAEWLVCLWATVGFFLFNSSSIMWQGGFSVGPRYLVPMLPFMITGLGALAVSGWGKSVWVRGLTAGLALVSAAVVWAETIGGQQFPDWTLNPLFNYSWPHLAAGNIARNLGMALNLSGWGSLIPLAVGVGIGFYLLGQKTSFIQATALSDKENADLQLQGTADRSPLWGRDTDPTSLS